MKVGSQRRLRGLPDETENYFIKLNREIGFIELQPKEKHDFTLIWLHSSNGYRMMGKQNCMSCARREAYNFIGFRNRRGGRIGQGGRGGRGRGGRPGNGKRRWDVDRMIQDDDDSNQGGPGVLRGPRGRGGTRFCQVGHVSRIGRRCIVVGRGIRA